MKELLGRASTLCTSLAFACACSSATPPPEAPPVADAPVESAVRGPIVHFSFQGVDGKPLTSDAMRGRLSVIGFGATYDMASQAQARFLTGLFKTHVPRVNTALLILEPPANAPMVEAFVQALELPYPVAYADDATIAGHGPFAGLHSVPSVVVLDGEGREVWRRLGIVEESELHEVLKGLERSAAP
jgi:hypothetical protein